MTPTDIKALAAPVSEAEPCGPDLEMLGDAAYMQFVARIEGVLPKSFAKFDRAKAELPKEVATLRPLIEQSRDLRLFVFLAKLLMLDRDLAGFVATVQTIGALLETQWEPVYPQLLDGDPILRVVSLQTLDDLPDAVMPLQSIPLFHARRFGNVSYRSHLLASGIVQGRTGASEDEKDEEIPAADAVRSALTETDIAELVASRGRMLELRDGLKRIEEVISDKTGQSNALAYERIAPLAHDIVLFLDEAITRRDPSLGLSPAESGAPGEDAETPAQAVVGGPIRSFADAQAALAAATRYFMRSEPSSPILLLIGQAEALMGKSFYDAMQALVPELTSQATIRLVRNLALSLPLERLSALTPSAGDESDFSPVEEAAVDYSEPDPPHQSEGMQGEEPPQEEPSEESASGGEAQAVEAAPDDAPNGAPDNDKSEEWDNAGQAPVSAQAHKPGVYRALSRNDAVALLSQVAAYFRVVEPSSPVPIVLDYASALAGRDFVGLLRDVLPASALSVDG